MPFLHGDETSQSDGSTREGDHIEAAHVTLHTCNRGLTNMSTSDGMHNSTTMFCASCKPRGRRSRHLGVYPGWLAVAAWRPAADAQQQENQYSSSVKS